MSDAADAAEGSVAAARSFEDDASHPLIVPMPKLPTAQTACLVGGLLGPIGLGITVMVFLPVANKHPLHFVGYVVAGIVAAWALVVWGVRWRRRSAVRRIATRFMHEHGHAEVSHQALGELVSSAMGARGCHATKLDRWTRRDFDELCGILGKPVPLVWSIDGFERDWLVRMLWGRETSVEAQVRRCGQPPSATVIEVAVIAAFASPVFLVTLRRAWLIWIGIMLLAACIAVVAWRVQAFTERIRRSISRAPEGLMLNRTDHSGAVVESRKVDPRTLVIMAPVYYRSMMEGLMLRRIYDHTEMSARFLPPLPERPICVCEFRGRR